MRLPLLTLVVLVYLWAVPIVAAEKYALLIGVTVYEHARMNTSSLKYPEDDAEAVAKLLRRGGYTVKELLGKDATKAAIERELKSFSQEGNINGVVLIGMFGHGVQYEELAFFGPYDTTTRVVKDFKGNVLRDKSDQLLQEPDPTTMVSMRDILDAMTLSKAKNKVLLADCCREDTNAARGRNAFGSNLTTADLPEGTAALFACSRNEQAYEHDDWQHGAFTRAFLDQVEAIAAQGNVKAGHLAERIQEAVETMVKEKTARSQNVTYLNSGIVDLQLSLSDSDKDAAAVAMVSKVRKQTSRTAVSKCVAFDWTSSTAGGRIPKDWTIEGGFGIGQNKGRTGLAANAGHHSFTIPELQIAGDFLLEVETQQLGGHKWELKLQGDDSPLILTMQDNYINLFVILGDPETKTQFFPRDLGVPSGGGKPRVFRTRVTRVDGVYSLSVNDKQLIPAVRTPAYAQAVFNSISLDVDVRKDAIPFSVYQITVRPL